MEAEARRLIVALDFSRIAPAYALARRLAGSVGMFKVGSQLFTAEGPHAVEKLAGLDAGIFLDLKFHDIPSIVAGAVTVAARLPGVRLLTVHTLGGYEMARTAAAALHRTKTRARLLGVTILTSQDAASLRRIGIRREARTWAVQLARLARKAGLDGVVASAHEVGAIRKACGKSLLIVVPGIRPGSSVAADQARVATPGQAIRAGADYLVVGRPITEAPDPRAAASQIVEEIARALNG